MDSRAEELAVRERVRGRMGHARFSPAECAVLAALSRGEASGDETRFWCNDEAAECRGLERWLSIRSLGVLTPARLGVLTPARLGVLTPARLGVLIPARLGVLAPVARPLSRDPASEISEAVLPRCRRLELW